MNYTLRRDSGYMVVSVEASFTLLDFLMMIISFLIGSVFMMIFYLFTAAVIMKIFVRYEFHFDMDSYEITRYMRVFNFFRFRLRNIGFGEVKRFLLSNHESGQVLLGRGMGTKEWYTIDAELGNSILRIVKVEEDELEETYELFEELKEELSLYFKFDMEFVEPGVE